ncbi:hypothetical protein E2493_08755 [Sphingomonas parva]|uniref:VOC family protein n=1 Tax=Sphingomonas parva TaxID=2555898 RepID=A0A4Y8ZTS7_9SPHN|nr:hypothetical protein [Sphingomonas parva]TFI58712.1 hypothetical protein E2493_08755 [Sphingomonas parva]
MLFHMSMAAERPEQAARMIAELWGGRAYPFPPVAEGSWIAMAGDDRGSAIEFLPLGTEFHEGEGDAMVRDVAGAPVRHGPVHVAIATELSIDQVKAIGARHGAPTKVCSRGPFRVIELWLEGTFMIEVLTAEMQSEYLAAMHFEGWEAFLAEGARIAA